MKWALPLATVEIVTPFTNSSKFVAEMAAIASSGWRNSACVMMLSGPFRYCREPQATLGKKPFLEYTSELREQPEIVFVKRHSQSGFMVHSLQG